MCCPRRTVVPSLVAGGSAVPPVVVSSTGPPTPDIYTLSLHDALPIFERDRAGVGARDRRDRRGQLDRVDRKSTRLNSSHVAMSYAVFCLKKKRGSDQMHCLCWYRSR